PRLNVTIVLHHKKNLKKLRILSINNNSHTIQKGREFMKKIISFVLTILIVFSCTYSFSSSIDEFQVGDEDIYEGVPGYRNIRNNILYKDVKKTWGRSSIYKLSALGF